MSEQMTEAGLWGKYIERTGVLGRARGFCRMLIASLENGEALRPEEILADTRELLAKIEAAMPSREGAR